MELGTQGTWWAGEPPGGRAAGTESRILGRNHTWVNGIGHPPLGEYQ